MGTLCPAGGKLRPGMETLYPREGTCSQQKGGDTLCHSEASSGDGDPVSCRRDHVLGRGEAASREWILCPLVQRGPVRSRREAEPREVGTPCVLQGEEDILGDGDLVPCRRDHVLGGGETVPRGGGPSAPQR